MASLKVLSSNSSANCYIIDCGGEKLIVDLGVKFKELLKGLDYTFKGIAACLCTHKHQDHSRSVTKMINYQIPVYSNEDVANEVDIRVRVLQENKKYKIGNYLVQPIAVSHNVPNFGYLIEHKDIGRLLFLTDLSDFPYTIKNLDHIIIEANHDMEILLDRLVNNEVLRSQSENHLSLDKCIEVLERNICSKTKNIVLIHLSELNSSIPVFKEKVRKSVGFEPIIAEGGIIVNLSKEEF